MSFLHGTGRIPSKYQCMFYITLESSHLYFLTLWDSSYIHTRPVMLLTSPTCSFEILFIVLSLSARISSFILSNLLLNSLSIFPFDYILLIKFFSSVILFFILYFLGQLQTICISHDLHIFSIIFLVVFRLSYILDVVCILNEVYL